MCADRKGRLYVPSIDLGRSVALETHAQPTHMGTVFLTHPFLVTGSEEIQTKDLWVFTLTQPSIQN